MLTFTPALLLLQAASAQIDQPPPSPPTPPPPACASEAHGGFDFWVGEWEVFPNGSARKAANSTIERVSTGCVIREHWQPLSGRDGTSMSFINPANGRWEQLWVGADGKRVEFAGGVVDGKMVLSGFWPGAGANGADVMVRMTYSVQEDGSVRQFGEGSTDQGLSWQTSFDLIYRRKGEAESKDTE